MADCYIVNRHQSITRQQAFDKIGREHLYVSDESLKVGISIDDAQEVGVDVGGAYLWMTFNSDNILTMVNTYGRQSVDPEEWAASALGIQLISEHDDEFPYHQFPVDVREVEPTFTKGPWCGYVVDGYIYPYNKEDGLYYIHLETKVADDFNFETWLDECVIPEI